MHALWAQQDFLLLGILVYMLPLCVQLQTGASDAWLVSPTSTVTLLRFNQEQLTVRVKANYPQLKFFSHVPSP